MDLPVWTKPLTVVLATFAANVGHVLSQDLHPLMKLERFDTLCLSGYEMCFLLPVSSCLVFLDLRKNNFAIISQLYRIDMFSRLC